MRKIAEESSTIVCYKDNDWYVETLDDLNIEGLLKKGRLHYTIEEPIEKIDYLDNRLVVVFPGLAGSINNDVKTRWYGNSPFGSLSRGVGKNTYILRIADSNLISGSYFVNTPNFPDYESKVQDLINDVRNMYTIKKSNTILWGESRGAVGALLHVLLGGYKTLSVDPILDRRYFTDEDDYHYQFDLVPESFVDKMNEYSKSSILPKDDINVLTTKNSIIAFPYINQLDKNKINILDFDIDLSPLQLTSPKAIHGYFIQKSIAIQLSIINKKLFETNLHIVDEIYESDSFIEDINSKFPVASQFFNKKIQEHYIEFSRNDKEINYNEKIWSGLEFTFYEALVKGEKYQVELDLIGPVPQKLKFLMWGEDEKLHNIGNPTIDKSQNIFVSNISTYKYEFEAEENYLKLYSSASFIEKNESLKIRKLKVTVL